MPDTPHPVSVLRVAAAVVERSREQRAHHARRKGRQQDPQRREVLKDLIADTHGAAQPLRRSRAQARRDGADELARALTAVSAQLQYERRQLRRMQQRTR